MRSLKSLLLVALLVVGGSAFAFAEKDNSPLQRGTKWLSDELPRIPSPQQLARDEIANFTLSLCPDRQALKSISKQEAGFRDNCTNMMKGAMKPYNTVKILAINFFVKAFKLK